LRAAKHSNPLTQLPGNVPLYERIDDFIQRKLPFVAAYVDINHFKPFNDAFGYSYGDEMILRLSKILTNSVNRDLDFVGHVGGDDFVVIFRSKNWHNICQAILNEFTQSYNDFVPRAQNEYWSTDRNGHRHSYGELTLAIGCVAPDLNSCLTHHHISVLLAEAKRSVKLMGGNAIFVSRRRHPSAA
jgi:diguanylate cyclase (GGDEF)-like protein